MKLDRAYTVPRPQLRMQGFVHSTRLCGIQFGRSEVERDQINRAIDFADLGQWPGHSIQLPSIVDDLHPLAFLESEYWIGTEVVNREFGAVDVLYGGHRHAVVARPFVSCVGVPYAQVVERKRSDIEIENNSLC